MLSTNSLFLLVLKIISNVLYAHLIQPVLVLASLQQLSGYTQRFLYGLALLYFYISYQTESKKQKKKN